MYAEIGWKNKWADIRGSENLGVICEVVNIEINAGGGSFRDLQESELLELIVASDKSLNVCEIGEILDNQPDEGIRRWRRSADNLCKTSCRYFDVCTKSNYKAMNTYLIVARILHFKQDFEKPISTCLFYIAVHHDTVYDVQRYCISETAVITLVCFKLLN